jgi:hypothetical protein
MKFMRNKETGQVVGWNKQLDKLKVMVPCEGPSGKPVKKVEKQVKPAPVQDIKPPKTEPSSDLLSKDEAMTMVQKWFNLPVDKVKVVELYAYAKEQTGEDFPEKMTKLQIVTKLAAELAVREE